MAEGFSVCVESASQNKRARQSPLIEGAQHQASQCRHEGLIGELVATKQVAQALRLIGRGRKDQRAHRAVFDFADEYTHQQETETVKDLNTHQRAQLLDERNELRW